MKCHQMDHMEEVHLGVAVFPQKVPMNITINPVQISRNQNVTSLIPQTMRPT